MVFPHKIIHYSNGDYYKVKYRNHFCYRCGTPLTTIEDSKVVNSNAENAKYYNFSKQTSGANGQFHGDVEFVHNLFYCQKCGLKTEFLTQLSLEDLLMEIERVERFFKRRKHHISIDGEFEAKDGRVCSKIDKIEEIQNILLYIFLDGTKIGTFKSPLLRSQKWEQPYYFNIKRKDLIVFIRKLLTSQN